MAVILDGNRRWAARREVPLAAAYRMAGQRVQDLADWCDEVGIAYATVWALSEDNLGRGAQAVGDVLHAVTERLEAMAAAGLYRIRVIGSLHLLPPSHTEALKAVEENTRDVAGTTLTVAAAYQGRGDIIHAVRALVAQKDLPVSAVTENRLAEHLSTAGQPDIDLLIRTSGEQRLSGFMPWQTAQAELYFTATHWPDFDRDAFQAALRWYRGRDRRRGL